MPHDNQVTDKLHARCAEIRRQAADLAAAITMVAPLEVPELTPALLEAELDRVVADLDKIAAALAGPIATAQRSQLSEMTATGEPLRLNIGSGPRHLEGWINVDLTDGDVIADCRRPLPFGDGTASHIYACHVLEHLRHPDEAYSFLRECRRVLRLGGKVRVVVPNIDAYLRAHVDQDATFWETHQRTWPWSRGEANRLDQTLYYAGAGISDDNFFGHRHGYDEASLLEIMRAAGLTPVRSSRFQASTDPVFHVDDRSAVAHVQHDGRALSLFAEGFSLF